MAPTVSVNKRDLIMPTKIEWSDETWNPVTGCTKVSQGCKHCYAERDWPRLAHLPAYKDRAFTEVSTHDDRLDQPLRWSRPRLIFVNSMSDLFHDDVPFSFIAAVFGVMAAAPHHTFQVLTKRPTRMLEFFRWIDEHPARNKFDSDLLYAKYPGADWRPFFLAQRTAEVMPGADRHRIALQDQWPLPNVWLGVSVEDQAAADERIPLLIQTPAAVRWISAEPLLGRVDLRNIAVPTESDMLRKPWDFEASKFNALQAHDDDRFHQPPAKLDWVVVGGESGPKARPMPSNWVRDLRDQCSEAGVPFLFKQWGEWAPLEGIEQMRHLGDLMRTGKAVHVYGDDREPDGRFKRGDEHLLRVGKKGAGRLLDGVLHDEYPVKATAEGTAA